MKGAPNAAAISEARWDFAAPWGPTNNTGCRDTRATSMARCAPGEKAWTPRPWSHRPGLGLNWFKASPQGTARAVAESPRIEFDCRRKALGEYTPNKAAATPRNQ